MADSNEEDWHLRAWMRYFGKRQAAFVNELGWDKSRANFVWHSKQPYRRELVNEISAWLGIRPYELLMPPAEALALQRLRDTAKAIVEGAAPEPPPVEPGPPTIAKRSRNKEP